MCIRDRIESVARFTLGNDYIPSGRVHRFKLLRQLQPGHLIERGEEGNAGEELAQFAPAILVGHVVSMSGSRGGGLVEPPAATATAGASAAGSRY